jgi:hypothetical protein
MLINNAQQQCAVALVQQAAAAQGWAAVAVRHTVLTQAVRPHSGCQACLCFIQRIEAGTG